MAPGYCGLPSQHTWLGWAATVLCSVLSVKGARALRELRRRWLRAAGLGTCAALAALLLWGSLGADDGVTEVLAHRGEVLPGKFIEVPCSEDYDSHRRFEGTVSRCSGKEQHVRVRCGAFRMHSVATVNPRAPAESGGGPGGWPPPTWAGKCSCFGPLVTTEALARLSVTPPPPCERCLEVAVCLEGCSKVGKGGMRNQKRHWLQRVLERRHCRKCCSKEGHSGSLPPRGRGSHPGAHL